jgi:hypothetical protein
MQRWGVHRLAFAVVAPTGAAAILAWALFGTAGLEMVAASVLLPGALALTFLRIARLVRMVRKPRPVQPEDRERRRSEREHRRRARAEAFRRYGDSDTRFSSSTTRNRSPSR